jgi:hypothetical protein
MAFLPEITNDQYTGASWAPYVLGLGSLQSLIGGALHVILPDSGLGVIANLNLAHEGGLLMIGLAAWVGATQIAWGSVLALVALRYRNFTLPIVSLLCLEKSLIILGVLIKPTNTGNTPPGIYAAAVLLALSVIAIYGARAKSD